MWRLNHERLLKLYAVCLKSQPVFIVTEYMKNGTLKRYLRGELLGPPGVSTQLDAQRIFAEAFRPIHTSLIHCDVTTDTEMCMQHFWKRIAKHVSTL